MNEPIKPLAPGLPNITVTEFNVGINPSAFFIAVGHQRMSVIPEGIGPKALRMLTVWEAVLTLSPITAKQLLEGLQKSVAIYEANHGDIPVAPLTTDESQKPPGPTN